MRITTRDINESGSSLEFNAPADRFPVLRELARRGECAFTGPIRTRLRVARIGDMIEMKGQMDAVVRLTCGRCLAEFVTTLSAGVALTYAHQADATLPSGDPKTTEVSSPENDLIYFQGEDIDLTEGIQEQVILTLPVRPLCSDQCRGLCAHCGADLNLGTCNCIKPSTGSPFDVLSRLKREKR